VGDQDPPTNPPFHKDIGGWIGGPGDARSESGLQLHCQPDGPSGGFAATSP
jgi:hypothetical protein